MELRFQTGLYIIDVGSDTRDTGLYILDTESDVRGTGRQGLGSDRSCASVRQQVAIEGRATVDEGTCPGNPSHGHRKGESMAVE